MQDPVQNIAELYRRVRDLEHQLARDWLPVRSGLVNGFEFVDTTTANLSTTETAYVTTPVIIPAHWQSYDLVAAAACQIADNSGGSTGAGQPVIGRVRTPNAAGSEFLPSGGVTLEVMDLNYHDTHPMAWQGILEAQTATGVINVVLTLQRSGTVFNVVADQLTLRVDAIRRA